MSPCCAFNTTETQARWSATHLLQTEDECLGAQDLVHLPGLAQSLLDDVAIVIVILWEWGE